jgi:hypothetical protein
MHPDQITITELTPRHEEDGFIGKVIQNTGKVTQYPKITWWRPREVTIEPSVKALFTYLSSARKRNVCLIRGANANPKHRRTRRQIAHRDNRGDHGFVDQPSRVQWMDGDGIELPAGEDWITDPAGVVAGLVARMGEPWCNASYVWFFSSTHGLEFDEYKVWTGGLTHNDLRVRLGFITSRAITEDEAHALTAMARVRFPEFDPAISRLVQPNYITRARWEGHPGEDVLGTIPTIGWVQGEEEFLAIPDDLTMQARWIKAQGHGGGVAKHPSAEAAIRNIGTPIGSDEAETETKAATGTIRPHLWAAASHLLRANSMPKGVTKESHAATITQEIERLIEEHRSEIEANLKRHHRRWSEVTGYLERNVPELIIWMISRAYHPGKTVELIKEKPGERRAQSDPNAFKADLARMRERVAATIKRFAISRIDEAPVPVALLNSQTGGGKSTKVREAAVALLNSRPPDHEGRTVVIALPTHRLGVEQTEMFEREHHGAGIKQAIVRGRYADDPENPGKLMCLRPDEAEALEKHMVTIDDHLCSKGRGKKRIICPRFHECGYQRQKITAAGLDLAYVAHEALQHRKPAVVGYPQMLFIDESPLDAFLFGTDVRHPYELPLDALTEEPQNVSPYERAKLMQAREDLHGILDALPTSDDPHVMTPAPMKALATFSSTEAAELRRLEWMEQAEVNILPNTPRSHNEKELERLGFKNNAVAARATLWRLIEDINRIDDHGNKKLGAEEFCGHIQVARDEHNRVIRMCGIRPVADSWEPSKPDDEEEDNDELDTTSRRFDFFGPASGRDKCAHCGKRNGVLVLEDTFNQDRPMATLHRHCATAYFDARLPKGKNNKRQSSKRTHQKIPILITDATGDAEILKHIWPQITSEEHPMLHNPHVKTFQIADKALSKTMIAPENKTKAQQRKREKTIDAARRMYAALLRRGLEYGGERVAAIVYKSTEDWITENCFIPDWLTLTHHGAVAGLDEFKDVRALFVIGRPLPPADAVVRQAEALTGRHIAAREYLEDKRHIRIVTGLPGPFAGCDAIEVAQWRHPDRLVERLRWQVCERSIIQAAGRARSLLRTAETPLDLHLWTDVPVPELGRVIPQLWADMKVGLDWIMLASGGVWIENDRQAGKAYPELVGEKALEQDRRRHPQTIPDLEMLIGNVREKAGQRYVYQLAGKGFQPVRAFFLNGAMPEADETPTDPADPFSPTKRIEYIYTFCRQESLPLDITGAAYVKAWLEQRLGALRSLEAGWPPHTSPLFGVDLVPSGAEVGTPALWSGTAEELAQRNAEAAKAAASAPPKLPWTTPVLEELALSQEQIDRLNAEADAQEAQGADIIRVWLPDEGRSMLKHQRR